jgi:carboxyvinyl-carboxyphosphonate phosphorylmutase
MAWTKQRDAFRAILAGDRCVTTACVSDPLSARMAQSLGFEAAALSGSIAALALLGTPDLMLITLTELADYTYRICRSFDLPLLADADHGYGNALNVMRTVEELERAGVAGLTIEDTALPKPFGDPAKAQLIPLEEGVGKMRAAVAARRDPGLAIVARTSAVAVTGLADALARFKAYAATGVDAIYVVNARKPEELEAIAAEVKLPILIANVGGAHEPIDYLARVGVRVCFDGHAPYDAGIQATYDTMKALREGASPQTAGKTAAPAFIKELAGEAKFAELMNRFLK